MQILLRPGCAHDFDYCKRLYFAGMERIIQELKLDLASQAISFRKHWDWKQVRVITLNDRDIGWLQCATKGDAIFLAQLFVDTPFQLQGIGTGVMHEIIAEAASAGLAMTLGVVKTNPALRLYQRLGFRTTHEDEHKFYMRRESSISTPP